jgi:hypothetical protein
MFCFDACYWILKHVLILEFDVIMCVLCMSIMLGWLSEEWCRKYRNKLRKNAEKHASRARRMFFAAATPSRARQKAVAAAKGLLDFGSKHIWLHRGRDELASRARSTIAGTTVHLRGRDARFEKFFFIFLFSYKTRLRFPTQWSLKQSMTSILMIWIMIEYFAHDWHDVYMQC